MKNGKMSNRELEDFYFYLLNNEAGSRPRTAQLRDELLDLVDGAMYKAGIDVNAVNA